MNCPKATANCMEARRFGASLARRAHFNPREVYRIWESILARLTTRWNMNQVHASRREFVKHGALGAAALAGPLASSSPGHTADGPARKQPTRIRIGVRFSAAWLKS